ncbi:MAG: hypothetical protein HON68_09200 [Gammaproteobacteria bacterium]|nr:hypothetical protein [Gammaproteobacteria bacterium]MBT3488776.1 hypothetical protein [Gammaproteobacteria bacterium]MBT3719501.1 hypothetical protein [Gammaproteobacteria bacterium]MBT3845955.1 hypothetical protein [Gammaproteobacteria bacterium]MBT4548076.1 hypothetical protein [Gammaproteobacteria bacterium]
MSWEGIVLLVLGGALVVIVTLHLRYRSQVDQWNSSVTTAISRILEEGDYSVRINSGVELCSEAEQVLNHLIESKAQVLQDIQGMVESVSGKEKCEALQKQNQWDLHALRAGVDLATDHAQNNMQLLHKVVSAIGASDFGMDLEDAAEHELADFVSDSMSAVEKMFEQISAVMNHVAHGNFSHRITMEAQGDLLELKEVINQSMAKIEHSIIFTTNNITRIGDGDFTSELEGSYSGQLAALKDAVNAMQRNLSHIVSKVRSAAHSVRLESEELTSGTHRLSSRTGQQASALEESAASMEQMNSTVQLNAQHAKNAEELSQVSRAEAVEGTAVVQRAVEAMSRINESSDKISEIIELIDGIAFQTNLLALNAAVEAARAGDHGRGFAVVAGEVRSLAQRSADAAKEIAALISETSDRISDGNALVNESGESLESIVESIGKVSVVAKEISSAAHEQGIGIEQVNRAITEIDQVNQQNSALVDETAETTSVLKEQATALASLMEIFALDETVHPKDLHRALSNETVVLDKARSAHLAWKGKIRGFLDGFIEMDINQAVSHHDCVLGKWLDSEGREKYKNFHEMSSLDDVHAKMHAVVKKVIELKKDGKKGEAEQEFLKISPYSKQVVEYIDELENDLL